MLKKFTSILSQAIFLIFAFIKKAKDNHALTKIQVGDANTRSWKMSRNIISALSMLMFGLAYGQVTQTITFNSTGSAQTFKVPAGVTSLTVEAWGAGGAGGGGNTNNSRGAGGGGGYTKFPLPVTAGTIYNVNVGVGGVGTSNPGGTGGISSLDLAGSIKVSANGGIGGSGGTGGAGGTLGLPTTGTGLVRTAGGKGGDSSTANGGGGGGSAGTGGNGGNGGNGGSNGGGAAGAAGSGNPGAAGGNGGTRTGFIFNYNANPGAAGANPGAGGGGRSAGSGNSNTNGGAGANGRIIISYTINLVDLKVVKTSTDYQPGVDEVITFTIVASNKKTTPAVDVVVTDILPTGYTFISANQAMYDRITGRWEVGTLAGNASATLTITAIVKATGIHNNTATILSEVSPEEVPADNTSSITVTVCQAGIIAPQVKN